jgi:hypothetical protein
LMIVPPVKEATDRRTNNVPAFGSRSVQRSPHTSRAALQSP